MATALAETVSHYIPSFEKVEINVYQKPLPSIPTSPDGAGADMQNTLVLSQPEQDKASDSASNTSSRSRKSDKIMQKKLEFETGNSKKVHKRVLRTLSKTLRPSSSSSTSSTLSQPAPESAQPPKKTLLQHTVSQHEIKRSGEVRRSGGIKRVDSLRSDQIKKSSELKKSVNNVERKNSNAGLQRKASNAGLNVPRKGSNAGLNVQRKGSSAGLRPSNLSKTETATTPELKKPELKNSGNIRNSGNLRRSGNNLQRKPAVPVQSQLRQNTTRVEASKIDALNVLLNDFEMQKQRAVELAQAENEIYKQELSKYEEMLQKKKEESEAAIKLANNIKEREAQLEQLFMELQEKEDKYQISQDEFTNFNKEFEEELKKREAALAESSTSAEKTSALRMKAAQERKALKEAWRKGDSSDPAAEAHKRMIQAQDDLTELQTRISNLKKELGRMKGVASKGKSSDQRLRDEKIMRDEARRSGTVVRAAPKPKAAPRQPEKRAHQSRLEEEKAKRAAKKKAANMDVAGLIAQQAGVSRSRYGSPYRAGVINTMKSGSSSR